VIWVVEEVTTGVVVFWVTATVETAELQIPELTTKLYVPPRVTTGFALLPPEEIPPAGPVQVYPPPPEPFNATVVVVQVKFAGELPALAVGVVVTVTTTEAHEVATLQFTFAA
jgi:hypothetical protein